MPQYAITEISYSKSSYANSVGAYSSSDGIQDWLRQQFEIVAKKDRLFKLAVEQIGVLSRFRPTGVSVADNDPRDFAHFLLRSLLEAGWEPFALHEGYIQDQGKEMVTYYLRRQE
jgi:hypothetical protein